MAFFDLNIPYDTKSSSSSIRANRIKIVAKLMELGYSGIAYNRTMKGVMSDHDRCSIPLINFSSLQCVLPSFFASVEFHRDLLGVPRSAPFHQYTRLTVCINSSQEVLAVNSGNLVLKTYDLIAVKPLNQYAFDQACEKLEIDIIAIDFAEKLPFRLKQGLIKSAIQRGVYFEIVYTDLLSDVHERRQMISTAKLLVDWTKGKNLILSSAASSVNEIRGPYDVANLSSLLGVSTERAKAAVSKNSKNLIANALKRKQFYKETIRVERISSDEKLDPNDPWSVDTFKWDPISSGEGDLLLDDIAKSFAAINTKSNNVKAIDFTSVMGSMPSQGFLVKSILSGSKENLFNTTDGIEPPVSEKGVIQPSPPDDHFSTSDHQCPVIKSCKNLHSHGDASKVSSNSDEGNSTVEEILQPKISIQEEPSKMDIDIVQPSSQLNVISTNEREHSPASTEDALAVVSGNGRKETFKMPENVASHQNEYVLRSSDTLLGSENVPPLNSLPSNDVNVVSVNEPVHPASTGDVLAINFENDGKESLKMSEDANFHQHEYDLKSSDSENVFAKECLLSARLGEPGDLTVAGDQPGVSPLNSCISGMEKDYLISIQRQTSEVLMGEQNSGEADPHIEPPPLDMSISGVMSSVNAGTSGTKQAPHPALKLPLKQLINPMAFKKVRSKRRIHQPTVLLPFKRLVNPLAVKKEKKLRRKKQR